MGHAECDYMQIAIAGEVKERIKGGLKWQEGTEMVGGTEGGGAEMAGGG